METVEVTPINNVFMRVKCSDGIAFEIYEHFVFTPPNAKYDKRYKARVWDGKIRVFKRKERILYTGLVHDLEQFCKDSGYKFVNNLQQARKFTYAEVEKFCTTLDLPFPPYEYQIQAVVDTLNDNCRGIILSPTGSGKSLIIYILSRMLNKKTLIVVPTKSLVRQMANDFKSYNYKDSVSQIMEGASKDALEQVTVSTWQSIYEMPSSWFSQFLVLFGDEAHGFGSKSMVTIGESSVNAWARIGLSGTLGNNDQVNTMVLKGLFGRIKKTRTTKELMDTGHLSNLDITAIRLQYPDIDCKDAARLKREYPDEIDYITTHDRRQEFIVGLASRLKGNTLVLFRKIDHGKELFAALEKHTHKKVRLVYGKTDVEAREMLRTLMETEEDVIGVCSYKTFATGTNVKNLHNIIFGSPVKSQIQVLQAIGRVLRLHESKSMAYLFDIGDCMTRNKTFKNHAWRHFILRLEYYIKEDFKHKIVTVKL